MGKYISDDNSNWMSVNTWLEDNKGKYIIFKKFDKNFFGKLEGFEKNTADICYRKINFSDVYYISGPASILDYEINNEPEYFIVRHGDTWFSANYALLSEGKNITMKYITELFYCEDLNKLIRSIIDEKSKKGGIYAY